MSIVGLKIQYQVGQRTGPAVLAELATAFETAGDNLRDFGRFVFPKLAPAFEAAEKRQFDAQGDGPQAGPWAPLSEAYVKWKEKHYPGKPTLQRTGALMEALTASRSPLAWREWTASEFGFGTVGVKYASFHQLGTKRMPARPPFDLDAQFQDDLRTAGMAGVREAMRAARLEEMGVTAAGAP